MNLVLSTDLLYRRGILHLDGLCPQLVPLLGCLQLGFAVLGGLL